MNKKGHCWQLACHSQTPAGFDSGWQIPFLPGEVEQQQSWLAEGRGFEGERP